MMPTRDNPVSTPMREPPPPASLVPDRSSASLVRAIYLAPLLFLLGLIVIYLVIQLQFLLILLFASVIFAAGLTRPVARLEGWKLPRPLAILVIYLIIAGLIGAVGWYILPQLAGQSVAFVENLPTRIEQARRVQTRFDAIAVDYPVVDDVYDQVLIVARDIAGATSSVVLDVPRRIATAIFAVVTIATFTFLLLLIKERAVDACVSLFAPRSRAQVRRVANEMGDKLGAYLRAKAIVIVVIGFLEWLLLVVLGAQFALLVAILGGLMEAIPRIGPWIARVLILLVVLPLGVIPVIIAMVGHVLIENFKGYLLSPLVEANQVDVHPLTAFVAIIAGGLLLGWVGALFAVPAAAVIQVVVEDVLVPWRRAVLERTAAAPGSDRHPQQRT